MSHVVDVRLERRMKTLSLLQSVAKGISGMLDRGRLHPKIGHGERTLNKEEIASLCDAYFWIVNAIHAMEADVSKEDLSIEEVCASKEMVAGLHQRGLYTVIDLHEFGATLLRGLFAQCECLGVRCQLHMYLFAGDE